MEITKKIHILKIDFDINVAADKKIKRFVNSIVIFGDRITLIDTGVKGAENDIFEYIIKNNRGPSEISTIILSHSHPDHIGSASAIKKQTGCRVLAHEAEREWIEDIDLQAKERPVPGFFDLAGDSVKIDGFLRHNQLVKADDNITLRIVHSPGHSKGSINILFQEDRILFTADSVPLKNDIPNYDNFKDMESSLNFIKTDDSYDVLLTSWTPPLLNKDEINNTIAQGQEYIRKIDGIVKKTYAGKESFPLEFCGKTISELGLPPFLVTPMVDKTLRSHLEQRPY